MGSATSKLQRVEQMETLPSVGTGFVMLLLYLPSNQSFLGRDEPQDYAAWTIRTPGGKPILPQGSMSFNKKY